MLRTIQRFLTEFMLRNHCQNHLQIKLRVIFFKISNSKTLRSKISFLERTIQNAWIIWMTKIEINCLILYLIKLILLQFFYLKNTSNSLHHNKSMQLSFSSSQISNFVRIWKIVLARRNNEKINEKLYLLI